MARELEGAGKDTDENLSVQVGESPCGSVGSAMLAANGALSLLNLVDRLLGQQIKRLEEDFLEHGGLHERM